MGVARGPGRPLGSSQATSAVPSRPAASRFGKDNRMSSRGPLLVLGIAGTLAATALGVAVPAGAAAPGAAAPGAAATGALPAGDGGGREACSPTAPNRPVCAHDATLRSAAFLDPTAVVRQGRRVELDEQVYIGPFARLHAERGVIHIGPESNVQDNVRVDTRGSGTARQLARVGLRRDSGIVTGERVILAHGSSVKGPARLGVGRVKQVSQDGETVNDSGVFVSFGAQVDGAVIERDAGLSALARVGPGVRLRTGLIVLPGKNVTRQAEADDPALGKVRPITAADREFNAGVVEVNVGLAREYSRLARERRSNVRGVNVDPGGNEFDRARDRPSVESDLCTGPEVRVPGFRNRVIGDTCFEDSLDGLNRKMGSRISIRADEGGPFGVGTLERMDDGVVFHALEGSDLRVGDRVRYGKDVIVHGGGRPQIDPTTRQSAPTAVGNDVVLRDSSVVFRSLVRNRAVIGTRSVVVGSELKVGQRIPDRTIYANDEVAGRVEW